MGKHIKTNNYSEAILESWNDFKFFNLRMNEHSLRPQLLFDWIFKTYDGSGSIDCDESHKLRNVFGDNASHLALSMNCREKHIGLKPTDSLYNDQGLSIVFQKVLDSYFKN